jgi:hypothetical protein
MAAHPWIPIRSRIPVPRPGDPGAGGAPTKKSWKTPPPEIALRRLARAEELGMTYREYTLEILERGIHR